MRTVRVVSLVPSVTETLLAWGVTPVGVTRFCEQPLPSVGGTKDPDVPAIVDLAPDLVVVDEEENRLEDHDALVAAGLRVHVTAVRSVADVAPTLAALADAVASAPADAPAPPRAFPSLRIGERILETGTQRVRVVVPIWRRPWIVLGHGTYGSSLLHEIGFDNAFSGDERYPTVDAGEIAAHHPDLIVVPTEPYPFKERHLPELEEATRAPAVLVDGQDLFWWGARTPASAERLASTLRPSALRPPPRWLPPRA